MTELMLMNNSQFHHSILCIVLYTSKNKYNVMVVAFPFKILSYKSSKVLDLVFVITGRFFTPVSTGFYAHKANLIKDFNDIILNEVKVAASFNPLRAETLCELFFE